MFPIYLFEIYCNIYLIFLVKGGRSGDMGEREASNGANIQCPNRPTQHIYREVGKCEEKYSNSIDTILLNYCNSPAR